MDYEVFHATNPYMSAVRTRGRNVVSVLDLIPLELDSYRQLGLNARLFLKGLVPRADRIIALSHFTAGRIMEILGVPVHRIVVASLPPASTFQPEPRHGAQEWLARRGIRHPYIVAVADGRVHDPRKRAEWLPVIGRIMRGAGSQLVVAGSESQRLFREDDHVIVLGRISDADLARLLGAAQALVFTSAYEGQGLPPLEAMACGTPVVAMRNSAISEVVGDGGILIEENTVRNGTAANELAEACVALVYDESERGNLSRLALRQSRVFTLSAFGTALARAYVE
jgi:glycosyltransferase involved in cell wall biosynthesis